MLAQAGVRLGVSYPHRIVSDLPAARRATVRALLATRAAALDFNDPGGYDLVTVDGTRTRVFTKQEFRLDANGQPKGDGGARRQQSAHGHAPRRGEVAHDAVRVAHAQADARLGEHVHGRPPRLVRVRVRVRVRLG